MFSNDEIIFSGRIPSRPRCNLNVMHVLPIAVNGT
jgi:hypothetical protein